MQRFEINYQEIESDILCPGDVYWKKKSGKLVLISRKSNYLNLELIKKLHELDEELLIQNSIDLSLQIKTCELFKAFEIEIRFKKKISIRPKIIQILSESYGLNSTSQFEIDQVIWKVFSRVGRESAREFMNYDIDLFKRSMTIASSVIVGAFILGYYDLEFLSRLYENTFLNLMNIDADENVYSLKSKLETIRLKESWDDEEREFIRKLYRLDSLANFNVGEKSNGSGVLKIQNNEMSELEYIQVLINNFFPYDKIREFSFIYAVKELKIGEGDPVFMKMKKILTENNSRNVA